MCSNKRARSVSPSNIDEEHEQRRTRTCGESPTIFLGTRAENDDDDDGDGDDDDGDGEARERACAIGDDEVQTPGIEIIQRTYTARTESIQNENDEGALAQQIDEMFALLHKKDEHSGYLPDEDRTHEDQSTVTKLAEKSLELGENYDFSTITDQYIKQRTLLMTLALRIHDLNLSETVHRGQKMDHWISVMGERLYNLRYLVQAIAHINYANNDKSDYTDSNDAVWFGYSPFKVCKLTPLQELICFLQARLYLDKQYKRRDDPYLYEEIIIDGKHTRTFKRGVTLKEYIFKTVNKNDHFTQWQNLTTIALGSLEMFLMSMPVSEFPFINPSRHVFSFTNGIYDVEKMKFYAYDNINNLIPPDLCACKYFPYPFVDYSDQRVEDIRIGVFEKILGDQKLTEDRELYGWIMALFGRFLYDLGTHDRWDVCLYIKGIAGTGKSRLASIIENFYPAEMLGTISNNIQETFGLETIYNKWVWGVNDATPKLRLQNDFLTMVDGMTMSTNRKNQEAISFKWKAPGYIVSNEWVGWVDNAGNLSRRIAMIVFDYLIQNNGEDIDGMIQQDMPSIIYVCNRYYREYAQRYPQKMFYSACKIDYFNHQRQIISGNSNQVGGLFQSQQAVVQRDRDDINYTLFCTQDELLPALQDYAKATSLPAVTLKNLEDVVRGPFAQYQIKMKHGYLPENAMNIRSVNDNIDNIPRKAKKETIYLGFTLTKFAYMDQTNTQRYPSFEIVNEVLRKASNYDAIV